MCVLALIGVTCSSFSATSSFCLSVAGGAISSEASGGVSEDNGDRIWGVLKLAKKQDYSVVSKKPTDPTLMEFPKGSFP